jgi:hydroxymethylpyrimidine pyrophosphatase-like HAD family hydrolase
MTSPETKSSRTPEFNAGTFTISHFSDSPEGFEFATKEAIGRTVSYEGDEKLVLNEDQKSRLGGVIDPETEKPIGGAMRREMGFNGVAPVIEARQAWREAMQSDDEAETTRLHDEFLRVRGEYIGRGKKIGLRAVELTGNTLQADVQLVPYPVYNVLASPDAAPEVEKLSSAAGVAMVVETSDHRLVIQHRGVKKQKITEPGMTRGNGTYADIPGASVAGMIDASLSTDSDRLPGTPDPVDTDFLKANILKETSEELGIAPNDIEGLRIVGLAQDHYKPHDEVLFLSTLKLTASELREASRKSNRNKNLADADFEEKFFDIEGSPEAIETLLTDVKCPLPPTHAAAMVAAGYSMMVRENSPEAAHIWRERMQQEVRRNYEEIDQTVAAYYGTYTEMFDHVPERYWGQEEPPARNPDGYSPAYTPEEQGLPTLEDEMIRTGLMPETRTEAKKGRTYDVDGVLTDPREKTVVHEEIFDEIIAQLERGEPVCFNTGRSDAWVMDRVVSGMLERIQDKNILRDLIIVGEKGGTWTTFNREGEPVHSAVETISVPTDLKERVRTLISEKYSDVMFFDESKETMISVEMVDGYNLTAFTERQREFVTDIQALLKETKADSIYRVDPTTIATDIESPNVGKALGSDRFIEFLKIRGIKVESFEAFGDSGSDAAMADELARRGQQVELVYVGNNPDSVQRRADYPMHQVDGSSFSAATLAYLQQ